MSMSRALVAGRLKRVPCQAHGDRSRAGRRQEGHHQGAAALGVLGGVDELLAKGKKGEHMNLKRAKLHRATLLGMLLEPTGI